MTEQSGRDYAVDFFAVDGQVVSLPWDLSKSIDDSGDMDTGRLLAEDGVVVARQSPAHISHEVFMQVGGAVIDRRGVSDTAWHLVGTVLAASGVKMQILRPHDLNEETEHPIVQAAMSDFRAFALTKGQSPSSGTRAFYALFGQLKSNRIQIQSSNLLVAPMPCTRQELDQVQVDVHSLREYVLEVDAALTKHTVGETINGHTYSKLPYQIGWVTHEFYREFVEYKLGPNAFTDIQ